MPTTEVKPDLHNEEEEAQTNEQLIHRLMAQIPEYDWMEEAPPQSQHNFDSISILPTPLGIQYGKKGIQHVKGRGSINASTKHPLIYLHSVREWFNSL